MGHNISAIIGSQSALQKLADAWGCAQMIELPQAFGMIFLTDTFLEKAEKQYNISEDSCCSELDGFTAIAERLLQEYSIHTRLAYIETDYFGGVGTQGGVLYEDGRILIKPRNGEGTINLLLNKLGVLCVCGKDEFDSVNLGNYRHMQDF